ncbi:MAG: hypothetical protein EXS43_13590 [Opitutus sp.]|nr:hypothetical protein [Opitutus sp.]
MIDHYPLDFNLRSRPGGASPFDPASAGFAPHLQPMSRPRSCRAVLFCLVIGATALPAADTFYRPVDTQGSGQPLPAQAAVQRLRLPEGFQLTLAASEPDVRQPIAIATDDRGRLWVAENFSCDGSDFTEEKRDRIAIFDDRDGDGERTARHWAPPQPIPQKPHEHAFSR